MGAVPKTAIQWTDYSWPVINGCQNASPGCANCYSKELIATRLAHTPKYAGLAVMTEHGARWSGDARLWIPTLADPLKWKKDSRVFVADMGDLFYEGVFDKEISTVFGVMLGWPRHTYQVLTKRPDRMVAWVQRNLALGRLGAHVVLAADCLDKAENDKAAATLYDALVDVDARPIDHIHFGVSVEDQVRAGRASFLQELDDAMMRLGHPSPVKFLSIEPLLERVDIRRYLRGPEKINWVIVGGESGKRARPCAIDWIRDIVHQCQDAAVPVFVKQLGARAVGPEIDELPFGYPGKGGDPAYWPEDIRVREFPR